MNWGVFVITPNLEPSEPSELGNSGHSWAVLAVRLRIKDSLVQALADLDQEFVSKFRTETPKFDSWRAW